MCAENKSTAHIWEAGMEIHECHWPNETIGNHIWKSYCPRILNWQAGIFLGLKRFFLCIVDNFEGWWRILQRFFQFLVNKLEWNSVLHSAVYNSKRPEAFLQCLFLSEFKGKRYGIMLAKQYQFDSFIVVERYLSICLEQLDYELEDSKRWYLMRPKSESTSAQL